VLSAAVTFWAGRLGTFLFKRISGDEGKDSRFDEIRGSPAKFLGAFLAQATWVSLCLMPVLAINSIPATTLAALPLVTVTDVIGVLLYVGGISFEMTADAQKTQWLKEKKEKKHSEEFLTRGLWSKSRHPNYFGESTLWTGIATTAAGVLVSNVGQAGVGLSGSAIARAGAISMAAVSPLFVTFLLLKVSGVPLSEDKYDKRYGDRKDYQEWKKNTPMFIPKFWYCPPRELWRYGDPSTAACPSPAKLGARIRDRQLLVISERSSAGHRSTKDFVAVQVHLHRWRQWHRAWVSSCIRRRNVLTWK